MKTLGYVNASGIEVEVECVDPQGNPIHLAEATLLRFYVKKPNGSIVTWSASVGNEPNVMRYVTVSGDLDQPGTYILQPYIEIPGFKSLGKSFKAKVKKMFEE